MQRFKDLFGSSKPQNTTQNFTLQDKDKGPIPKLIHFAWAGPSVQRFTHDIVAHNRAVNPGCKCILWLDAFSMCPDAVAYAGHASRDFPHYLKWAKLADEQSASKSRGSAHSSSANTNEIDLTRPENFDKIASMLFTMRQTFNDQYLTPKLTLRNGTNPRDFSKLPAGLSKLLAQSEPFRYMHVFAEQNDITVKYVDLEYVDWYQRQGTTSFLCKWTLVELYRVSPNYGAWGDLVRVQLLLDHGGIYCDHDDVMQLMHDVSKSTNENSQEKNVYSGYKAARGMQGPVPSYQAALRDHTLLHACQAAMQTGYKELLGTKCQSKIASAADGLFWYWRLPKVSKSEHEQSIAYNFTMQTTGSSCLNLVVADFDANNDGFRDQMFESRVTAGASHAWLGEAGPEQPRSPFDPPGYPLFFNQFVGVYPYQTRAWVVILASQQQPTPISRRSTAPKPLVMTGTHSTDKTKESDSWVDIDLGG